MVQMQAFNAAQRSSVQFALLLWWIQERRGGEKNTSTSPEM